MSLTADLHSKALAKVLTGQPRRVLRHTPLALQGRRHHAPPKVLQRVRPGHRRPCPLPQSRSPRIQQESRRRLTPRRHHRPRSATPTPPRRHRQEQSPLMALHQRAHHPRQARDQTPRRGRPVRRHHLLRLHAAAASLQTAQGNVRQSASRSGRPIRRSLLFRRCVPYPPLHPTIASQQFPRLTWRCTDDSHLNCRHAHARGWTTAHLLEREDPEPATRAAKHQIRSLEELRDIFPHFFRSSAKGQVMTSQL